MTCNAPTDRPGHPTHPTAKQRGANEPTAAAGPSPDCTPESQPAPGSATDVDPSTLFEMIAAAAWKARSPAPVGNLLYSSLEWYAAQPATQPTPLTVRLWIEQTASLIHQYQELFALLVEMQVEIINRHSQTNINLTLQKGLHK